MSKGTCKNCKHYSYKCGSSGIFGALMGLPNNPTNYCDDLKIAWQRYNYQIRKPYNSMDCNFEKKVKE
jgi:hypothetical protein